MLSEEASRSKEGVCAKNVPVVRAAVTGIVAALQIAAAGIVVWEKLASISVCETAHQTVVAVTDIVVLAINLGEWFWHLF